MLSKKTKQRIRRNAYKHLQQRQLRFLRKYFIKSILIPMPQVRAAEGMKMDVFAAAGFTSKQVFLAKYAIGYFPPDGMAPTTIVGYFLRSQRDPTSAFAIDMNTHMLRAYTAKEFVLDLKVRRQEDLERSRNPNNCSTCKWMAIDDGEGGHCYMFRDAPTEVCMQHSGREFPSVEKSLRAFLKPE